MGYYEQIPTRRGRDEAQAQLAAIGAIGAIALRDQP